MLAVGKKKYLEKEKGQGENTFINENFSLIFQFPQKSGWLKLEEEKETLANTFCENGRKIIEK